MRSFDLAALDAAISRETREKLEAFTAMLGDENARQNLVSRHSLADVWNRHILDSTQLLQFAPKDLRSWIDIGSGGGFPGLVVAIMSRFPVTLAEPRRLRGDFLDRVIRALGLNASVVHGKAESIAGTYDVISARAVASLSTVLDISHHLSTRKTLWLCPKGKSARSELEEAKKAWHGEFHVERSLTDADSAIILARGVERNKR